MANLGMILPGALIVQRLCTPALHLPLHVLISERIGSVPYGVSWSRYFGIFAFSLGLMVTSFSATLPQWSDSLPSQEVLCIEEAPIVR